MNKKTSCITEEQFNKIINIIYNGTSNGKIKPSKEIALILTITGNCALRIGDCTKLKLKSFIKEGGEYKYNIIEEVLILMTYTRMQNIKLLKKKRKYKKESENE